MARLVLIDTADQLPGLLPVHSWSALMSSELVLVRTPDHPFVPHLDLAELRHEAVPDDLAEPARWIVDRVKAEGEVAYLFGPSDAEAFTRALGVEAAREGVEVEIVYFMLAPKGVELLNLVRIEERLRRPGGCPWDREQTHATLAPYAVEEVYELLDAIASGDPAAIKEELGDVLLQVVFHAQVAEDGGAFTIDDVAKGIAAKLVRRHPHVFADATVADADQVIHEWERIKAGEKPERQGLFDGIPVALPALQLMSKLQSRAERAGVVAGLGDRADERVRDQLARLADAPDDATRSAAVGDLLVAAVALARAHRVDPEQALRAASARLRLEWEDARLGPG